MCATDVSVCFGSYGKFLQSKKQLDIKILTDFQMKTNSILKELEKKIISFIFLCVSKMLVRINSLVIYRPKTTSPKILTAPDSFFFTSILLLFFILIFYFFKLKIFSFIYINCGFSLFHKRSHCSPK